MDWYDRAADYDRLFCWDPAQERDFLLGASARWGVLGPKRILEPFCGSGRLLRAMPGISIGFDRNANMVRYAARSCCVFRADAARFALKERSIDLAFCLIDSFRYLLGEEAARSHLRAVARALKPGAVYVLGFELESDPSIQEWSAPGIRAHVRRLGDADPETRIETSCVRLEYEDGESIESLAPMRTYTARQVEELIDREASFEIAAAFGGYDLERPLELSEVGGSVVLVLKRPSVNLTGP